jgi:predicted HicB family RNase H-like nuclease
MENTKFNETEYKNKFIKEKYDRINLTMPKGEKEELKKAAEDAGESVNEYINRAIQLRMGKKQDD